MASFSTSCAAPSARTDKITGHGIDLAIQLPLDARDGVPPPLLVRRILLAYRRLCQILDDTLQVGYVPTNRTDLTAVINFLFGHTPLFSHLITLFHVTVSHPGTRPQARTAH